MSIATDGFIFDLGEIDISANVAVIPEFDGASPVAIDGDVLLQYNWSRTSPTGSDPGSGSGNKYTGVNDISGMQGDWFNCFLFNVDASDISDANNEDIQYHTVKANWCGHSITRALNDKWQKPGTTDPLGDADTTGAAGSGADGTGKGLVNFTAVNAGKAGNYNLPKSSKVEGYQDGQEGTGDEVLDATTHLNLAGEFMRFYSAEMFGGRLRYGLDIFSNEYPLIQAVKDKDASLNQDIMAHLNASNTIGDTDGTERHSSKNIPHVLLSQLLSDPSGCERVRNTLSKPAFNPIGNSSDDASDGGGKAPSRTVSVTNITTTAQAINDTTLATASTANHDYWHRVPLKEGDKLRIKVRISEGNTEGASGALAVTATRTYIIEYLLKN